MDMKASVLALQFTLKLKHLKMQCFINRIIMDLLSNSWSSDSVQIFAFVSCVKPKYSKTKYLRVVLYFERPCCLLFVPLRDKLVGQSKYPCRPVACHQVYPENGCLGSSRNWVCMYCCLILLQTFCTWTILFSSGQVQSQFPCMWLAPVCLSFESSLILS